MKQCITHKIMIASLALMSAVIGAAFITATSYAAPTKQSTVYSATCTITNVPTTLAIGATMEPELTVTNTGTGNLRPFMITPIAIPGSTVYLKEKSVGLVAPGQSKTVNLGKFTPSSGDALGASGILSHSDLNHPSTHVYFGCTTDFTLVQ